MVAHTQEVLFHTERVMAIASDLEIGQRGYSLTGDERFLESYNRANHAIASHLNKLLQLTSDNSSQQERVKELSKTILQLVAFSAGAVGKRKESFEAARTINATLSGKELMDRIRQLVTTIEQEENQLLNTRTLNNHQQVEEFNYTFLALLTATGLILIAILFAANINLKARYLSEAKLKTALAEIKDLYDNAPCGYHALDASGKFIEVNNTLANWLGYEKDEMLHMKFVDIVREKDLPEFQQKFELFKKNGSVHNLEFDFLRKDGSEFPVVLSSTAVFNQKGEFVKSRSNTFDNTERKLAEDNVRNLNKELESFTYSVSHDLRAPLRSIDGYSRILQEDYAGKFDEEGRRVINVIINNAKRMGKLIDDLLDFARLGRKEVVRANLNMTQLAKSVAHDLLSQENRKIELKVNALEASYGDADMMRQVWENLLSNAVKYTSKTDLAVIEISSFASHGEVGYAIRDNGVGFDMQYLPKLFGVFQRLHKIQDFGGTGVGLAIVKRIVDRHEGRVWAEGKVNEGATFYFTIPNSNGKQ